MTRQLNELEENLQKSMFSKESLALLEAFGRGCSEETIDRLTNGLDIDNGNYLYLLMLGILGFQNGWKFFPKDIIPRIQGIHRYEQVKSSVAIPWFANQLCELEKAGIPVMLSGNTAMKYAFLPDVTRFIRGYDITVPSDRYDQAVELLRSKNRNAEKDDFHDRTINGLTEILLHQGVHDKRLFDEESFWSTCKNTEFQSHTICAPSLENQLLFCACVPYGHFLALENEYDRVYRLVNVLLLLQDNQIDLENISADAKRKSVHCQLRFQLALLKPFSRALKDADLEVAAEDQEYIPYLIKLEDYRSRPSIKKEYQLMNSCFRPQEKQVSFLKYIADTRSIHSLADVGNYVRKKTKSKRECEDKEHGTA